MGVLEDAIREHLELRRKHGASDDEVRRQEDDALGPARRETPAAEVGDGAEPEPGAETVLLAPEEASPGADGPEPADEVLPVEETAVEAVEAVPADTEAESAEPSDDAVPSAENPDFAEDEPAQDRLSFDERPRRELDFD
jgi:hypothetical protein